MSQVTTHILDTSLGRPASGVNVILEIQQGGAWQIISRGVTDNNGRIANMIPGERILSPGVYRLIFDTKSYFKMLHTKTFYPSVYIDFEITDESHYHVPLLLSPFGYSTYRGS